MKWKDKLILLAFIALTVYGVSTMATIAVCILFGLPFDWRLPLIGSITYIIMDIALG